MYKKILLSFFAIICTLPTQAQDFLPPRDITAAYWYGVVVILGMCSMLGLLLALANLYTQNAWLHTLTLGFVGLGALMGLGSMIIYFSFSAVGWVALLPVITATISALLVWARQRKA
jgi:hypothetical protein